MVTSDEGDLLTALEFLNIEQPNPVIELMSREQKDKVQQIMTQYLMDSHRGGPQMVDATVMMSKCFMHGVRYGLAARKHRCITGEEPCREAM